MGILPQIKNIIVVMLENRSLDNICGWLYSDPSHFPGLFLPAGTPQVFNGLNSSLWNPSNSSYFDGQPPVKVPVVQGTQNYTVPDPDPEEEFDHVSYQLNGALPPAPDPKWSMQGFVVDYEQTGSSNANQIMETYSTSQLPVISSLAWNFAVSDAWFCSVPSQTWPNRAFVHAGTANGNVNNGDPPDPLDWNVPTIFNVLESLNISWKVYSDTDVIPSLTRTMFPKLWDPLLDGHFKGFDDFKEDCARNSLPRYSFVEPSFVTEPNDEHPPHDVSAGEQFLLAIWQAVSSSPAWNNTLLLITYDEHGGCYDHVQPPWGAATPDAKSNPGQENFRFNRFGVRVPMVAVSPFITPGTVFRSNTTTPYDHTSILATLRDWLDIPANKMLPSARIAAAPTLAQVITLSAPGPAPLISRPASTPVHAPLTLPPNPLQKSLVAGAARRLGKDPVAALREMETRQHIVDFFKPKAAAAR